MQCKLHITYKNITVIFLIKDKTWKKGTALEIMKWCRLTKPTTWGCTCICSGQCLSMYVCPTVWSIGLMTAPAVDRGPVPEHQWDRRRHSGESSPPEADYFPSGPKPRWSQNYEGGTLPTASPSCNHSIQTLTFRLLLHLKSDLPLVIQWLFPPSPPWG